MRSARPSQVFRLMWVVLLGTTLVSWYWSYKPIPSKEFSWVSVNTRYTVRFDHGYVALWRPAIASGHSKADSRLQELSNDDISWEAMGRWKSHESLQLIVATPGNYMNRSGKVVDALTYHPPQGRYPVHA